MKTRKYIILILLTVIFAAVSGCGDIKEYQRSIYDDDSLIAKQADSYYYEKRVGNNYNDKADISFKTFIGKDTLITINADGEKQVSVKTVINVEAGEFKLCLVEPDDNVVTLYETDIDETVTLNLKDGKNRFIIVGRDAKGSISIEID